MEDKIEEFRIKCLREVILNEFTQIWSITKLIAFDQGRAFEETEDETLDSFCDLVALKSVEELDQFASIEMFLKTVKHTDLHQLAYGEQNYFDMVINKAPKNLHAAIINLINEIADSYEPKGT